MAYDIAVIPGDGIGPEIVDAAEPLFKDVAYL
jgi:tartrate dehydrogenase/decarboxylase/D-malate dehydrogenase